MGKSDFMSGFEDYRMEDYRAVKPAKTQEQEAAERHTCLECNGTGRYQGVRVHQDKGHCFACKGKGWFKTSYADRMKARQKARDRKVALHEAKKEAFCEANEGLIEALKAIASWHSFAATMLEAYEKWDGLTEKQTAAAWAAIKKVEAKQKERQSERAKKSGAVDIEAIDSLFKTAQSRGLKRPKFVTERLQISLAPSTGVNAGAIYVKDRGEYVGKIVGGKFLARREAPADILELLRTIAADPKEAAIAYGKATGVCACCGRELTDPASIAAGIGPICESKWF